MQKWQRQNLRLLQPHLWRIEAAISAGKLRQSSRSNRELKGRNDELKSKLEGALRDQRRLVVEVCGPVHVLMAFLPQYALLAIQCQEQDPHHKGCDKVLSPSVCVRRFALAFLFSRKSQCEVSFPRARWARQRGRDQGWGSCTSPSCSMCFLAEAGEKAAMCSRVAPPSYSALAVQLQW